MLNPIFLPTHFMNFADMAPKSATLFAIILITPWIPFLGDNHSQNLLTETAFDPGQFFIKPTQAYYLSMSAAGTYAVWWSAWQGRALTPHCVTEYSPVNPVSNTNLWSGHKQGILIKLSLFDHAVYMRHFVQTLRQFHSEASVCDWQIVII